jgi:multidrug efflux pump subunit AcrB
MLGLPGIMGKFLRWVPIVVIITLSASLFEALIILPCHVSEFVGRIKPGQKIKGEGKVWLGIHRRYAKLLRLVLRHRFLFIMITIMMLVGSIVLAKKVMYVDQFPADLIEIFSVNVSTPEGTSREATEERTASIEKIIQNDLAENELQNIITYVGYIRDYDEANVQMGSRYSTVFVYLTPPAKRDRSAQSIIKDLRVRCAAIDGISELQFSMVQGGPPVGKAIDIKIVGPDYEILDKVSDEMKAALAEYEGVTDVKDDHDLGKEELRVNVNSRDAARLGLNVDTIARTVFSGFEGIPITSIRDADDETFVRVMLAEEYRDDVNQLKKLTAPNAQGRLVEVGRAAKLEKSRSVTGIFHFNGERAVSVTGDVKDKAKNKHAVTAANVGLWDQFKDIGKKYPGYRIARTGEWEDNEEMVEAMINAALAAMLMIYTILVIQFKSFVQPFVVLASIPFGVIGVILALAAHGKPISIMAMMGMVGLMGVVVNDAIVTRLRPIILTSITTVLGLAPVIYGIGGYEPFVAPAAIVLAYGLVFATLLTLLVVPCMYSLGVDAKMKVRRLLRKDKGPILDIP